jgi:DNA-binding LacI/PurR family transcriptional regulator
MSSLRIQLIDFLQREVQEGRVKPGEQIPSENDFARALKINRTTVRSAFSELVIMGFLTRVPGKGTFVTPTEQKEDRDKVEAIAVIVADITGLLIQHVITGIQAVVEESGRHIILCNTRWDVSRQFRYIQSLRQNSQVVGVIISQATEHPEDVTTVNMLRQWGIPFVEIMKHTIGERTHYVVPDNIGGAYQVTKHLIDVGHTNIGIIWSGPLLSSIRDRFQGYRMALEEAGLSFREELVVRLDDRVPVSDDLERYERILSVRPLPTAVFCFNDVLALTFLKVCRERHIWVPDDLAVVGFDDLRPAHYVHPSLTTVAHQPQLLGMRAAEILLDQVEHPMGEVRQEVIETHLVVRESCGAKMGKTGEARGTSRERKKQRTYEVSS